MATQAERRAETRTLLLDAAADLFAERGVDGASIDAIADRAGRTSGAVYDHFGGKDGLLFELLNGWVGDVSAVVGAELAAATTLEDRLAVLWRNVSSPVAGDGRWIALEHELWTYAARNPEAREHLAHRYSATWQRFAEVSREWTGEEADIGPAVIGMLFGLEMMRRIDATAVSDEMAVAALAGAVAGAVRGGMAVSTTNGRTNRSTTKRSTAST